MGGAGLLPLFYSGLFSRFHFQVPFSVLLTPPHSSRFSCSHPPPKSAFLRPSFSPISRPVLSTSPSYPILSYPIPSYPILTCLCPCVCLSARLLSHSLSTSRSSRSIPILFYLSISAAVTTSPFLTFLVPVRWPLCRNTLGPRFTTLPLLLILPRTSKISRTSETPTPQLHAPPPRIVILQTFLRLHCLLLLDLLRLPPRLLALPTHIGILPPSPPPSRD